MQRGSEKIATMARVTTTMTGTVTETDRAMEMAIAGTATTMKTAIAGRDGDGHS